MCVRNSRITLCYSGRINAAREAGDRARAAQERSPNGGTNWHPFRGFRSAASALGNVIAAFGKGTPPDQGIWNFHSKLAIRADVLDTFES